MEAFKERFKQTAKLADKEAFELVKTYLMELNVDFVLQLVSDKAKKTAEEQGVTEEEYQQRFTEFGTVDTEMVNIYWFQVKGKSNIEYDDEWPELKKVVYYGYSDTLMYYIEKK
jgi:calcineurin-like phosphoesterase